MVVTRSNTKKLTFEYSKMSYGEAAKLCNEKRLETKLRRVEIPVQSAKRSSAKDVEVASKVIKAREKLCESTKKTIESIIDVKKKSADEVYEEKFYLTEDQICYVAGERCSNVKRIETTYGVTLLVGEPSFKNYGLSEIVVKGPSTEKVSAAKAYILENLPCTLNFPLQERFVARVRGPRGEKVRRLKEEFGVLISLYDGKVFISGMKDRAEAAREAINGIIAGKRKRNDADSETGFDAKRIRKPNYLL